MLPARSVGAALTCSGDNSRCALGIACNHLAAKCAVCYPFVSRSPSRLGPTNNGKVLINVCAKNGHEVNKWEKIINLRRWFDYLLGSKWFPMSCCTATWIEASNTAGGLTLIAREHYIARVVRRWIGLAMPSLGRRQIALHATWLHACEKCLL